MYIKELNKMLAGKTITSVEQGTTKGWMILRIEPTIEKGFETFLTVETGAGVDYGDAEYYSSSALHVVKRDSKGRLDAGWNSAIRDWRGLDECKAEIREATDRTWDQTLRDLYPKYGNPIVNRALREVYAEDDVTEYPSDKDEVSHGIIRIYEEGNAHDETQWEKLKRKFGSDFIQSTYLELKACKIID